MFGILAVYVEQERDEAMKKIVVATKNKGKIKEMIKAFDGLEMELVPLSDFGDLPDAVEDGTTFEENAICKAKFYMQQTKTACLADDSGLEVDVLNGAPGVYSARFAGYHADDEANNRKLLAELKKHQVSESGAAYRCVLAFVDTDGSILTADGSCEGKVKVASPQGDGGFGYDPYFYIEENRTIAQMSLEEKDKISHRGKALRIMGAKLADFIK